MEAFFLAANKGTEQRCNRDQRKDLLIKKCNKLADLSQKYNDNVVGKHSI